MEGDGVMVAEVHVNKFGTVTRKEYFWEPRHSRPEVISAQKYCAAVKAGARFRVNTYGPQDQDLGDDE